MLAEGRLAQLDTRGLRGFHIPDGVRAAILRRVEMVLPATRTILAQASVIGREFELPLLQKVSSIANAELETALDDAARAALIVQAQDSVERYRFVHALIPETLYNGLSGPARRELHQRIADAIEALYSPDLEPYLSELAHHHASSLPDGNLEKAHDYAARAAARAEKTFAYEEAARLYGLTLSTLDSTSQSDHRRRCELTLSLASALYSSGEFDRAREQFEKAAAAAIKLGDTDKQAIAVLGLGMAPVRPESRITHSSRCLKTRWPRWASMIPRCALSFSHAWRKNSTGRMNTRGATNFRCWLWKSAGAPEIVTRLENRLPLSAAYCAYGSGYHRGAPCVAIVENFGGQQQGRVFTTRAVISCL